jgi:excisionase family DNA binding protein
MAPVRRELALTSSQAARYLGVSQVTIRRWCEDGYLSHYRTPGGQYRFSRAQLDAFANALRREGLEARDENGSVGSER